MCRTLSGHEHFDDNIFQQHFYLNIQGKPAASIKRVRYIPMSFAHALDPARHPDESRSKFAQGCSSNFS
jgi:hypothetical protein